MSKYFMWAKIGDAEPEIVEVTIRDGKKVALSAGCPDPFWLDEPNCPCALISEAPLKPPKKGKEAEERPLPASTHGWIRR
jgi:hypothetical protein